MDCFTYRPSVRSINILNFRITDVMASLVQLTYVMSQRCKYNPIHSFTQIIFLLVESFRAPQAVSIMTMKWKSPSLQCRSQYPWGSLLFFLMCTRFTYSSLLYTVIQFVLSEGDWKQKTIRLKPHSFCIYQYNMFIWIVILFMQFNNNFLYLLKILCIIVFCN